MCYKRRSVNYMHGNAYINLSLCWKYFSNRHSFLQGRKICALITLTLGSHGKNADGDSFLLLDRTVLCHCFKTQLPCHAGTTDRVLHPREGRGCSQKAIPEENMPLAPSQHGAAVPKAFATFITAASLMCHHRLVKSWPVCTSQEPTADTGEFPWVRTRGLTLD